MPHDQPPHIIISILSIGIPGLVMLALSIATLRRDPHYLANIYFALGFFVFFLAYCLNLSYVLFDLVHSEHMAFLPFKLIWVLGTFATICFAFGQLVLWRGSVFVLRRRQLVIFGLMAITCFLVLLGKLSPQTGAFRAPVWETSYFAITFILSLFYSGIALYIGFRVMLRLGGETKGRYRRLLVGFFLMACTYLTFQAGMYTGILYHPAVSMPAGCGYLFGALLMYSGLIST